MTRGPTVTFRGSLRARTLPALGLCASLVVAPLYASPARAADAIAVEELIRQGVKLRQDNRDAAALPLFQRAYDLEPSPRTAAQLGMVEASLGYFLAAEGHLMEGLSSPRHLWIFKNRAQIEGTLREVRASIGTIEVTGTPAGAEVTVNGKVAGPLPLLQSVRVPEGIVQVTLRAAGFDEKSTSVKIAGGKHERLVVNLSPSAAGQQQAAMRGPTGPNAVPPPVPRVKRTTSQALGPDVRAEKGDEGGGSSAPSWVRPAAWVAGGLALGAFSLGGYNFWRMKQNQDAFNSRTKPGTTEKACSTNFDNGGQAGCSTLRANGSSAQRLGWAGVQAGGLLAALSIVGFIWSADSGSDTALGPTGAIASADPDGTVTAGWRFRF